MRTNRREDLFDPHRGRQPRGDNDRYIRREDVARILADLLRSGSYQAGNGDGNGSSDNITSFHENSEYWEQARRQSFFHGQRVNLDGFWITEWAPFSPGHYFTDEAKRNRDLASGFFHDDRDEYLPLGKNYMMLGGVGSLRFAPKRIGSNDVFVLGASSSGVSHEGIPLTCEQDVYGHVAQNLKQAGGVRCNVHGYMRHLPNEIAKLTFSQDVEKYCIHMIDIDVQGVARQGDLLCTAQILFPSDYSTYRQNDSDEYFEGDGYKTRFVKSWSFASFRPGHDIGKDMISLTQAAAWLEKYAERYGGEGAPILNDFDEIQNHFSSPIEFPLSAVKAGNINLERLDSYQRYLGSPIVHIANMEVRVGHTIQNVTGSTIILDSEVTNSLNTLKSDDRELAAAFEQIAKAVEGSNNAAAVATFKSLVQEAAQPKPDKGKLRQLWDGLVSLAPAVGAVAGAVAKITSLFL
jgi:hypothetical protein